MIPFRTKRYLAYRVFTAWARGKLGKYKRLPIPACVVNKIRLAFPLSDGESPTCFKAPKKQLLQ